MQDVQTIMFGNELRPYARVQFASMIRSIQYRPFVLKLEHEAQHPGIEIEICEERGDIRSARQSIAHIQGNRGCTDTRLRGQEAEDLVRRDGGRRTDAKGALQALRQLQDSSRAKWWRHEIPHANAH